MPGVFPFEFIYINSAKDGRAIYNICLDCNEDMAVYAENSELVCQSCGMTKGLFGIAFDEAQLFSQEGYTGQPTLTIRSDTHLHKTLKKYKIMDDVKTVISAGREVCAPERYHLLANCIDQYRRLDGKSINYISFLDDIFQAVSSEDWPRKEKILERLSPHLPKTSKTRRCAKRRFDKWWTEITLW